MKWILHYLFVKAHELPKDNHCNWRNDSSVHVGVVSSLASFHLFRTKDNNLHSSALNFLFKEFSDYYSFKFYDGYYSSVEIIKI